MLIARLVQYAKLMRFDRPIGLLLLLWPTLWGLWVAGHGQPNHRVVIIYLLGVVVTRALGCVINDIADRQLDCYVMRTKQRPLASGSITLVEAYSLLLLLSGIAFYLVMLVNFLALILAFLAIIIIIIYPLMKRVIHWPQFILGLAFGAWPILLSFAAIQGHLPFECWLLALAAYCWPIAYDTIYALVDIDDDLKIGIKSTAIMFGQAVKGWIGFFYLLMLALLLAIGILQRLNALFYGSLLLALGLVIYQQRLVDKDNRTQCFHAFLHSQSIGLVIFLGLVLGYLH